MCTPHGSPLSREKLEFALVLFLHHFCFPQHLFSIFLPNFLSIFLPNPRQIILDVWRLTDDSTTVRISHVVGTQESDPSNWGRGFSIPSTLFPWRVWTSTRRRCPDQGQLSTDTTDPWSGCFLHWLNSTTPKIERNRVRRLNGIVFGDRTESCSEIELS